MAKKENKKVVVDSAPILDKNEKVITQEIDFIGRGFDSLKDAIEFMETDYFKNLGKADQAEYKNWLNK